MHLSFIVSYPATILSIRKPVESMHTILANNGICELRQDRVEGEQRYKTVSDFQQAAALGQVLKDLNFQADRGAIVKFVEQSNRPESREVLPVIQKKEGATTRMSLKSPRRQGLYKANCVSKIVDVAS